MFRMENEIILRARMHKMYEDKEGARRYREWKQRGVLLDDMPFPMLSSNRLKTVL